jgi:hypothetical protein
LPSVLPIVELSVSIPATQKIPDFVPDDVKLLLIKFPSILRTGDGTPTPTHGVEHHIIMSSHPQLFLLNPVAWIWKNLKLQKGEFKCLESNGIVHRTKSPWASPLHMVPKKDGSWGPCRYH